MVFGGHRDSAGKAQSSARRTRSTAMKGNVPRPARHRRRQGEEYSAIVKEGKREKATLYWGDEMGLCGDHFSATCFAPMEHAPVVRATGPRFGSSDWQAVRASPRVRTA